MPATIIDHLTAELRASRIARPAGRIASLSDGRVTVTGIARDARLGDRVTIEGKEGGGEIVALEEDIAQVMPEGTSGAWNLGDVVFLDGPPLIWPDKSWIGRIVDPLGAPLDGRRLFKGAVGRRLDTAPANAARRRPLGRRIGTGLSVLDTLLPIVRGQRIGLFAGAGVGKSTLLARLATGLDADVVVMGLVGERGRELREFADRVLGSRGMRRSVIVAGTADQSALVRRRAAEAAMAVAEHFRDDGKHVLLLLDSITRFADAHREIALQAGEQSAMRGYPPSMSSRVMGLAERAGPGTGTTGDITAIFSVLVAGSDHDEPVSDTLRGVLDGHVVLDRAIAERGRFPSIDVGRSVSRALPHAATPAENALISEARELLGAYERSEMMIRAGLYASGSDPLIDRAISVWPKLDAFFASSAHDGPDQSFEALARCLAPDEPADQNNPAGDPPD